MANQKLPRRSFLQCSAGVATVSLTNVAAEQPPLSRLGLVAYSCRQRRDQMKKLDPSFDLFKPNNLLDHCLKVRAGGMQLALGSLDTQTSTQLRSKVEKAGMYIEAIVYAPFERKDIHTFTAQLKTAVQVGAVAVRTTIIPGRRYENYDSLAEFRNFEKRGRRALENAAPIAEKHRIPLAVENHKDHRNDERVALFEQISSEFVGACVDTGNSVALLEDPVETVRALAPWAHSVHLKDQSLQPYKDGFLLADIPLGQGSLDLKQMVRVLRQEKPNVNFSLELITRDPLKVPVFTEKYWKTFPKLSARALARHIRFVRDQTKHNLQYVSKLSPDQRVAREDTNVQESLAYAQQHLGL
ncbi:MAG: sugar phosphate isomerase/epimerase [Fuerstiella sp.]|nr:sugar phosphate isomerase/epimerase [Fuerstiella sp.]